ncbi:uncharacterized protein LOC143277027 [Babylonia areolata]|uniref:uncharacterized protein LOC143277027 n=1 Tax=Babylonia areolata TaxID=304850 RepID=UPI003FD4C592
MAGAMQWCSVLLVFMATASPAVGMKWNSANDGCSVCRYTIIHRLFDACFIHFCYKPKPSTAKYGHAVMRRASQPSDWLMDREARAPKKNVPTEWWRPLGLLFWANHPGSMPTTYN